MKDTLVFCALTAHDEGEKRHPQEVMESLGISYLKSVPQSLFDCWIFIGVEVAEGNQVILPSYLTKFKGSIEKLVGHGLSEEDVLELQEKGVK